MENRDERFMALAVEEGYNGKGNTAPNPAVGAVIAKGEDIVGVGYHAEAGQPHAEILALEQAGSDADGAELYVTLEPCCYEGRTPPCTGAIVESGVSRVIIGTLDPNPKVVGGGAKELRAAGVEVEIGVLSRECRELCEDFARRVTNGFPFVTAKYAMTLDGKIATPTGDSFWITSEKSRETAHLMRWRSDAVVVGNKTVWNDNPRLTVRLNGYLSEDGPVRIVVSSNGDIPRDSDILRDVPKPPTWVACTSRIDEKVEKRLTDVGAETLIVDDDGSRVDLKALIAELGRRGLSGVLVEGGGELLGNLMDLGLVDKVCAFIAPKVVGGSGKSPIEGQGRGLMSEAIELQKTRIEKIDKDLLFTGYITDIDAFFPAE